MTVGNVVYFFRKYWRSFLVVNFLFLKKNKLLRNLKKGKNINEDIVVSFTTISSRISFLDSVLLSIINGEMLPGKILLYLAEKEYNQVCSFSEKSLVKKLFHLDYLRIYQVDDVRSYKKLVFAVEMYPLKNIVICDDDILYPKFWLSSLNSTRYENSLINEKNIVAHRVHEVLFKNKIPLPYDGWKFNSSKKGPSTKLFPTGVGGVLYPPGSLSRVDMKDNIYLDYAPKADDIWFWLCALKNGYSIVNTNEIFTESAFLEIPNSQVKSLNSTNVFRGGNDSQLIASLKYFENKFDGKIPW